MRFFFVSFNRKFVFILRAYFQQISRAQSTRIFAKAKYEEKPSPPPRYRVQHQQMFGFLILPTEFALKSAAHIIVYVAKRNRCIFVLCILSAQHAQHTHICAKSVYDPLPRRMHCKIYMQLILNKMKINYDFM